MALVSESGALILHKAWQMLVNFVFVTLGGDQGRHRGRIGNPGHFLSDLACVRESPVDLYRAVLLVRG